MASRRYRSQLFQAFSRQTMRLGDRLAQTWRQAKLTATWGSQILLYPIYAIYQGTRLASRSIAQAFSRLPQLQAAPVTSPANPPIDEQSDFDVSVDTPIVRSLIALAGLELSNLTPLLSAADGAIVPASVAPIVVVDLPGAIEPSIHEMTLYQEDAIEPAIVRVRGLASLLSDRRLVLTTSHNQLLDVLTIEQQHQLQQRIVWELASYRRLLHLRSADRSLPLPADSPHLLPPIRSFQRLMAWMQQSPIAIATNLFGEAALLAAAPPDPVLPPSPQPRSWRPETVSMNRSPWAWLRKLFWPAVEESTLPAESTFPAESPAIVLTNTAPLTATSTTPQQQTQQKAWWKRKRLAANSPSQTPIAAVGREVAALPPQGFDRELATIDRTVIDRSTATTQSESVRSSDRLDQPAGAMAIEIESTAPTAAPTWIETEARLVGYVKHPLEQLLEWLDAGMLWLETTLSTLWHWLSRTPR